jgi:predicted nucleotidyltransferase
MVANRLLLREREAILDLARKHGATNVRVFGSAARDELDAGSDIDFLVDLDPQATLLDLGALLLDLEELLHRRVDVVTSAALHHAIRDEVLKQAVPL